MGENNSTCKPHREQRRRRRVFKAAPAAAHSDAAHELVSQREKLQYLQSQLHVQLGKGAVVQYEVFWDSGIFGWGVALA
jgi:hypothetical protein